MKKTLFTVEEVGKMIEEGKRLLLAGEEELLSRLPKGDWIGGTIPYFISAENGGVCSKNEIFVQVLPEYVSECKIKTYSVSDVNSVYSDAYANGFSAIIIPAFSELHSAFSMNVQKYPDFACAPLIGWISGIHIDDISKKSPKVFNGKTGAVETNAAVLMHCKLPASKYAEIGIVNLFKQGEGDTLTFEGDGFAFETALVNGVKTNLIEYLENEKIDTTFPLVADYSGAMINISIKNVDKANNKVEFYAPIFKDTKYIFAEAVGDYVGEFMNSLPKDNVEHIEYSCNCILNYLYCDLEGKHTSNIYGPITFGEIAYMLLNQTFVYLSIKDMN
jgi:hypothetical protein